MNMVIYSFGCFFFLSGDEEVLGTPSRGSAKLPHIKGSARISGSRPYRLGRTETVLRTKKNIVHCKMKGEKRRIALEKWRFKTEI